MVETNGLTPAVVARQKAQAVKKNGLLELVEKTESFNSIGGLDLLKEWLHLFEGSRRADRQTCQIRPQILEDVYVFPHAQA